MISPGLPLAPGCPSLPVKPFSPCGPGSPEGDGKAGVPAAPRLPRAPRGPGAPGAPRPPGGPSAHERSHSGRGSPSPSRPSRPGRPGRPSAPSSALRPGGPGGPAGPRQQAAPAWRRSRRSVAATCSFRFHNPASTAWTSPSRITVTRTSSRGTMAAEQIMAAIERERATRGEPRQFSSRAESAASDHDISERIILQMIQLLFNFIFAWISSSVDSALVLQACCGDNGTGCTQYTRIEDMDTVRERKMGARFAELCCGDQALAYDQTCCEGTVHNVANGNCCGRAVYDREDRSLICCNRTLTRAAFDSGRTQICCGQKARFSLFYVYFSPFRTLSRSVFEKAAYDSCCEASNSTFAPFRSDSHFCCDSPQSRSAGRSCCYLRSESGGISPSPYDTASQCCTYPYREISTMANGTCVE
ncbi:hypothetical protein PRIPAC_84891 [Pristionchus pacificus]|uniref:Galaxin-like repeats domain-containing protein n=1 Tax=Pristionchus pacificus TaxID=54126 RepID=A0A2A6BSS0_PRIPA|nr:hypothetical protein PRIPAC_84891 [Pristionchus pacificus]|eukprot:PDM68940.1 hypothetical protein PRIPAC_47242 [Pristionchus pacificus]